MVAAWMGRTAQAQDAQTVIALWKLYKSKPDPAIRDQLVEHYLPLVRLHAESFRLRLPAMVELDDLISAGCFGLLDAIESFDINRNVKFETFSNVRIKGAMLDHLRTMDWAPRLARQRARLYENAIRDLERDLGRIPTFEEIKTHLKVDQDEFERIHRDAQTSNLISLNQSPVDNDIQRACSPADMIIDKQQNNPFEAIMQRDVRNWVTDRLSGVERMVVLLYYYESMTMREIGRTLQLSESRVSQLHALIKARLRAELQFQINELEPLRA